MQLSRSFTPQSYRKIPPYEFNTSLWSLRKQSRFQGLDFLTIENAITKFQDIPELSKLDLQKFHIDTRQDIRILGCSIGEAVKKLYYTVWSVRRVGQLKKYVGWSDCLLHIGCWLHRGWSDYSLKMNCLDRQCSGEIISL